LLLYQQSHPSGRWLRQAGRGAQWVKESLRPWDPALAPNGQQQAQSAAKRLRQARDVKGFSYELPTFFGRCQDYGEKYGKMMKNGKECPRRKLSSEG